MSASMLPSFSLLPPILSFKINKHIHACHIVPCPCLPLTHNNLYDPHLVTFCAREPQSTHITTPIGHLLQRGHLDYYLIHESITPHLATFAPGTDHTTSTTVDISVRYASCLMICHLLQSCLPTPGLYDMIYLPAFCVT